MIFNSKKMFGEVETKGNRSMMAEVEGVKKNHQPKKPER